MSFPLAIALNLLGITSTVAARTRFLLLLLPSIRPLMVNSGNSFAMEVIVIQSFGVMQVCEIRRVMGNHKQFTFTSRLTH